MTIHALFDAKQKTVLPTSTDSRQTSGLGPFAGQLISPGADGAAHGTLGELAPV